ncbi:MAG TPA: hypothetical protein VFS54_01215 [Solirubrobacterales bacterium]|nr:hypothetical protein [Solirubrobacterales bacterium]
MSPEENGSKPEANKKPREDFIEKYERQLEIGGSVVLAAIGFILWRAGGEFLRAVGANLVAAGLVGFLIFALYGWVFRQRRQELTTEQSENVEVIRKVCERLEDRAELEEEKIQEAITAGVPGSLSEFHAARAIGLLGYDEERPSEEIEQAVLKAEESVDILEVSLKTMRNIDTEKWRGCKAKVRIILLDPLFPEKDENGNGNGHGHEAQPLAVRPLAVQRDLEEDEYPGAILKEVHDIVRLLPDEWLEPSAEGEKGSESESCVKLAKVMPTLSYFRIDDMAYFAPLVHKQVGDRTMHLELAKGGGFFNELTRHFDNLWNDEKRTRSVANGDIPRTYPFPTPRSGTG